MDIDRLASQLQKGDTRAGAKLFDYFSGKIYGFLLARVGRREIAEDLMQKNFLKIIQKIETFNSQKGNFSGWVWQIVRNTLIDYYREKKTVPLSTVSNDSAGEHIGIIDEKQSPVRDMRVREILDYIRTWNEEEQEIFTLHYISSLSYREISQYTGKSEGALRVIIHRLRKKLKQDLYEK